MIVASFKSESLLVGDPRLRKFRQKQKSAESERQRLEPWNPQNPHRPFSGGIPRVQLIQFPSFTVPRFWEICERKSEWLLYSATVVNADQENVRVQGYDAIEFSSDRLSIFVNLLFSVTVPIAPAMTQIVGCDGVVTQLTLFGSLSSIVRFQWWSESPSQWKPLIKICDEMVVAFGGEIVG